MLFRSKGPTKQRSYFVGLVIRSFVYTHIVVLDWQHRGRIDDRLLLHSLHWLLVRQRVTYKLAVLTHKVWTTATQTYLSELVQNHAAPWALHSSDAPMLVIPRMHTALARRAFSVAAPSIWNSLPADIRLCNNTVTFTHHVKTHLFKLT